MSEAVYMIAQIDVKDFEQYMSEYGMAVSEQFAKVGAEILVATNEAQEIEGQWHGNWTVMVKFANADAVRAWYDSPEYAPFKAARMGPLTNSGNLALLPAFDSAILG